MEQTKAFTDKHDRTYSEDHLLSAAFNSTESVRFIVTHDGTIVHFNRKAYENGLILHNKPLKRGDNIFDYAKDPGNDVTTGLEACLQRAFSGETFSTEVEIKFESGIKWFKSEYVPVFDKLKIIAASIQIFEITAEKQNQLATERALDEMKSINSIRLNESKVLVDLIIKYAKDGLKALNSENAGEVKRNLLDLTSAASAFRTKIARWKKL